MGGAVGDRVEVGRFFADGEWEWPFVVDGDDIMSSPDEVFVACPG